uniref:Uncharacterized protein n=1 Tax=Romanomermis culicivorax TaxID=13658 RepID=A0A915K9R1_ROMCU
MAVVDITNGKYPLLFINNTPNSIKLRLNQLVVIAKHRLESVAVPTVDNSSHLSTAMWDWDLTDH